MTKRTCLIFSVLIFSLYAQGQSTIESYAMDRGFKFQSALETEHTELEAGKVKYFVYDLGLQLSSKNMSILVRSTYKDMNYIPHVSFPSKVATLATNEQEFSIRQLSFPADRSTKVEWSAQSDFIPKFGISRYAKASYKSYLLEDNLLVEVLYLYNENEEFLPEIFNFQSGEF